MSDTVESELPPIVKAGAPVLRTVAKDVPEAMFGTSELLQLVERMVRVMRAAPGVGLAATQIGVPLKVLVMEDRPEYVSSMPEGRAEAMGRTPFALLALCNPMLQAVGQTEGGGSSSRSGARWPEGCLSVPGYKGLVERYTHVRVRGRTPEGEQVDMEATGWQARILQHEVDHLMGVLYLDRVLTRSIATGDAPLDYCLDLEGVPPSGPCSCTHPIQ